MSTGTLAPQKSATTPIVIAAVLAVAFWALKPVFITALGPKGGFSEVYLAAGGIAVAAGLVVCAVLHRQTRKVLTAGAATWRGLGWAAISGLFLALWYYGFYRSLYGAPKADATIIAFTWPLISAIAMQVFSPGTARKLHPAQWGLVLLSFVGVAAIGITSGGGAEERSPEILWAFAAALGSGMYLPFSVKSLNEFTAAAGTKPLATFYSITAANTVAVLSVGALLLATKAPLDFSGFDLEALVFLALIGLGTYLAAEIAWTWAFQEYKSLKLATLPFFSPAVSVVLLFLIFGEQVTLIAVVGMLLILASNLALHLWRK